MNAENKTFALARYNFDGTLDTTFSGDGKQTTDFAFGDETDADRAYSVAIQSDGKIVVVGRSGSDFT
jgi:sugar lactone lactonase YvrE